ncbi:MAG: chemotaxis protein CheC [Candidatus Omnitrophota bacterium]
MEAKKVHRALQLVASLSIDKASQVFSKMIKVGAKIELEKVYVADISRATEELMVTDDFDVIGAFVDLVGDMPFKFLFYVAADDSLALTDLILHREPGVTKKFDLYVSSTVQELGNVLASAVTNVFASDFQIQMKPTPPQVVHDFASTVFGEYIMEAAADQNEILMIESMFKVVRMDIKCRMFLLPKGDTQKTLSGIIGAA